MASKGTTAAVVENVKDTAKNVKEGVKDALVGHDAPSTEPSTSTQTRLRFERHASETLENGAKAMTQADFINAITPPEDAKNADYHKIPRSQYAILFNVADRRKAGKLSLQDYAFFEHVLNKPDAEYDIAFRLFDTQGAGVVKYDDFVNLYKENSSEDALPFDWDSEWASLYIGGRKARHAMTYYQFSQMLRGLQGERVRQAFHHYDTDKTGYIHPDDFQRIIEQTSKHKLSDHIIDNLHTLCTVSMSTKISYANVRAFQNIIKDMDLVELIVQNATAKSKDGLITRTDFLNEAAHVTRWGSFTPMEADVLFHFASLDNNSGRLSLEDFQKVVDPSWQDPSVSIMNLYQPALEATKHHPLRQIALSAYNFGLGAIAGAFGATMVYPIDLVKTRMQNQRAAAIGARLYENSIDCAQKVIRNEGFKGLYRGLGPQLIGVAPEKAIKLTVNDAIRGWGQGTGPGGKGISLPFEILAGGSAGGCQVIFTNPLEIVKIRLQIQGEIAKSSANVPRRSAAWIVKNLGLVGLYKGASACLLRDIPFSAIYFPTYAHLKKDYFGEGSGEGAGKKLGILQLLTAGAIAGMPAAYLTTPFDVIKTRLQVEARKGETKYRGLVHAAQTIMKEEGPKAFFKGGPARVLRSSPQFGFTLAAYEALQRMLPMPGGKNAAEEAISAGNDVDAMPFMRSRNALKIILDLDENFGRPKFPTDNKAWSTLTKLGGQVQAKTL